MRILFSKKMKKLLLATVAATLCLPTISVQAAEDLEGDNENQSSKENLTMYDKEDLTGNDLNIASGDYKMIYGGGKVGFTGNSFKNYIKFYGDSANGIFGGMSTLGDVYKNQIEIRGGYIYGGVVGGATYFPYDGNGIAGNVYGNKVEIWGGSIGFVSGGEVGLTYQNNGSDFTPDTTQEKFLSGGEVSKNQVIINGNSTIIRNGIVGGSSIAGKVHHNEIQINDGTIYGQIIGGEVRYPNDNSEVTDNVIKIYGSPNLSNAELIGGLLGSEYYAGNNTLHIYSSGITAKSINGFGSLVFHVPENHINNSDSNMLTLTNGSTSLDNVNFRVFVPGNITLKKDDTLNLIYNSHGLELSSGSSADVEETEIYNGKIIQGTTLSYDLDLQASDDATSLTGTVNINDDGGGGSETEVVNNIPIPAPLPVIFIDTLNIPPSVDPIEEENENDRAQSHDVARVNRGLEVFLDIGGSHMRSKTGDGSHTTSDMQNYTLGAGKILKNQASSDYFAPIIEHHTGDYDTFFSNGKKGNGNVKYTAGGVIGRHTQKNNGLYYEGSFRAGHSENNFSSDEFVVEGVPVHVDYSMSAPLFAGHVRFGQIKTLVPGKIACDIYGIYAYARQNGMSTDLSSGEHVDFDSVYAHRFKVGYRMTTRAKDNSRLYGGLAYQYDSNSSSTAHGNNWDHSVSGASGSSVMVEMGWHYQPTDRIPLMVDIYATGWIGYHKGATAMAKLRKTF